MVAQRKYFVLCVKDSDGNWSAQFGDYERSVVMDEREYYHDSYCLETLPYCRMKVISCLDSDADIKKAVAALNSSTASGKA